MKINLYPYKIFNINEKTYLYTVNSSGIFEIDSAMTEILKCNGLEIENAYKKVQKLMSYATFQEYIHDMANAYLLKTNEENIPNKETAPKEFCSMTLMLAQECNLRCTYCYGKAGEYGQKGIMSVDVALKAIDYLIENTSTKKVYIAFFGGEPLIKFDLICKIVQYCRGIEAREDREFCFSITTNGTLINSEIEDFLIYNKVSIQVSIDGIREKHNTNRYFEDRTGSYDCVLKNTERMRKNGMLIARATASKNNLNFIEIFEHLYSVGFSKITITVAQNMLDDNDFEKYLCEYKKYIWYFYNLVKSGDILKAVKMNDIVMPLRKIEFGCERELSCGVAQTTYAVDISGEIYPCHRFVSNKNCIIGNIYNGMGEKREDFVNGVKISNHDQCTECWVANLCLGGCPNDNYINTGDIKKSSKRNCRYMNMLYEELITVYLNLNEDEKKFIFSECN